MNAVVYKGLSDAQETRVIETGKTLYESFDNMKAVYLVNGEEKPYDYIVQEGDIVLVRPVPDGVTAIVVGIIVAAAVGTAVYTGYQAYQLRKQAEALQEKMNGLSGNEGVVNLPDLKGARNAIATNKTMPYIIGEHLFTPYKLMNAFYSIGGTDGVDQYYHVLLEGGFASQVIRKIYCDDVILKEFDPDGVMAQEGVYEFDNDLIYGSPFYDAGNRIEIRQLYDFMELTEFKQKIIHDDHNLEIKKRDKDNNIFQIITLPEYTYKTEICLTINGLQAFSKKDGSKQNRTVGVLFEYSLDGGYTFDSIAWGDANTRFVTRNTNNQLRFIISKEFTFSEVTTATAAIMIRARSLTNTYDGTAYDTTVLSWAKSYIYDPDLSTTAIVPMKPIDSRIKKYSTLIGMKIKATDSNQDKLTMINMVTAGMARTWDADNAEWTSEWIPTSNPAAWLLEVLTSDVHGPSKCFDTEIDFDSFGELYQYCEDNELSCDMVILEGDTKENILNAICQTCFATLYRNIYGKISVVYDDVKPNAVAVLNSQRLISFENKKDLSRITDGIRVTYTNRDAGYVKDTRLVMRGDTPRTGSSIIRDVSAVGITNPEHAWKYARRLMNIELLRPRVATARVGKEGQFYSLLSKVLVQHPSIKRGLGSSIIKSIIYGVDPTIITGLELYDPIEYNSASVDGYAVEVHVVTASQSDVFAAQYTADTNGAVYTINFVSPIDTTSALVYPWPGNVLSYGEMSADITMPMLITGIEADSTGYVLTLVDYNEDVYEFGVPGRYTPRLAPQRSPFTYTPSQAATKEEVAAVKEEITTGGDIYFPDNVGAVTAVAYRDYIEVSFPWDKSQLGNTIQYFDVEIDKGAGFVSFAQIKNNVIQIPFSRDVDGYPSATTLGDWMVRVRAVNVYGKTSPSWGPTPAGIPVDTSIYGTWSPSAPVLSTRVSGRGISIGWAYNDLWYGVGDAQIQIAKGYTVSGGEISVITDTGTLEWYAPAIGLDPSLSYDNFREGTLNGYLERGGNAFFVSVPLYGQNENPITSRDTPYFVRVRSTSRQPTTSNPNAFAYSAWTTPQVVYAHASGAQDVVRAWQLNDAGEKVKIDGALGAQQIYAEFLAAISANLGVITDGAMVGNENNLWALSRIYNDDGVTVKYYEGTVKMGGVDQYLHVNPLITNGVVVGYNIDFKVGNFTVTAVGSIVNGSFEVRNQRGDCTYFIVEPENAGRVTVKKTLNVGTTELPTDRIMGQDGLLVTGTVFDGDGIDDLEVVEDGTVLGTYDVEIVDDWYEVYTEPGGNYFFDTLVDGVNIYALSRDIANNRTNIHQSTDSGQTWIFVKYLTGEPRRIVKSGESFIIVTADKVYRGDTVNDAVSVLDFGGNYQGFDIKDDKMILARNNGTIHHSEDFGYTWITSFADIQFDHAIKIIDIKKISDTDYIYHLVKYDGFGSVLEKSVDTGVSWVPVFDPPSIIYNISTSNGYLLAFSESEIYKSVDKGNTWVLTEASNLVPYSGGYLISQGLVAVGVTYDSGDYRLCVSTDQGASFFVSNQTFAQRISSISSGSPYGILSTGSKIYKSASLANQTARWRYNAGAWSSNFIVGPGVTTEFTGYGVKVGFGNAFGHVKGDTWSFENKKVGVLSALDENGDEYFALRAGYARSTKPILAPSMLVDCSSRVAEYTGDGGSTSILDRAGNGNNLTATNITYVNGKYGKEMMFNGSTSFAQASSPVIGTSGTIAIRFKMNQLNKAQYLITNSSNTYGFRLYTESNNVINLFIGGDSGYDNYNIGMVSDTTYYHTLIVTVNGLNATVHRDGVTTSITLTRTLSTGLLNLMFGYYPGVPNLAFNGIISHFRYDSRIWTADEALAWSLNPSNGGTFERNDILPYSATPEAGKAMVWGSEGQPNLPCYSVGDYGRKVLFQAPTVVDGGVSILLLCKIDSISGIESAKGFCGTMYGFRGSAENGNYSIMLSFVLRKAYSDTAAYLHGFSSLSLGCIKIGVATYNGEYYLGVHVNAAFMFLVFDGVFFGSYYGICVGGSAVTEFIELASI